ncbi:MAG: carbohydrate ABC transporter substrate-binding protein [Blautia sp.]|nr:carbohydrate ABC transporter substrate-binding protein [Blautia sp.]
MKKMLSLGLASVMALSMISGLALSASAEEKDYEDCTIKFAWWGGDSRHEATQNAVNAFMEKYPGINVEVNFGAWSDWEAARALEFQSGTAADVNQINLSWINEFDSNGDVFVDLNEFADVIDLTQWGEMPLQMMQDVNGGQAGIPVSMTGRIFYWDKTTFEEAGLEVPTSFADLRAAGPIFQEKLGDDYYPLALGEFDRMIFMTFYLQAKYGTAIMGDGEVKVTAEQLQEGLDMIMSLEEEHVIPSIVTIDGDAASSLDQNPKFIEGKYAGILEWDSAPKKYINALAEGREMVVGEEFTDFGDNGATGVFSKVSLGFAISATSEHKKESAMLIEYLCNDPEGVAIMASERGIPESAAAVSTLEAAGSLDPVILEAHTKVMAAAEFPEDPTFESNALKGSEGTFRYVFGGLSYGEFDTAEGAEELLAGMQDAYN